jgi:hypothetical protein
VNEREHGDWSLCQAVRYTACREALALLHRDLIEAAAAGIEHEPIHWWHWTDPPPPPPAPPSGRPPHLIEANGRRYLLDYGIETEFRHKLYDGRLRCWGRPGSPLAEAVRVPPGAVVGIKSWYPGGGILRLADGQLLYDARVEKVARPTRPTSRGDVEKWLLSLGPISADNAYAAAKEYFGKKISRARIREMMRELGLLQRPGRR